MSYMNTGSYLYGAVIIHVQKGTSGIYLLISFFFFFFLYSRGVVDPSAAAASCTTSAAVYLLIVYPALHSPLYCSPSLSSLSSPCPFLPTHSLVTLSPPAISHTPTSLVHLMGLSGSHQFTFTSLSLHPHLRSSLIIKRSVPHFFHLLLHLLFFVFFPSRLEVFSRCLSCSSSVPSLCPSMLGIIRSQTPLVPALSLPQALSKQNSIPLSYLSSPPLEICV